jgi:methylmalonyl-CoA/ethylmalonyl-CoA epimerase
MITKEFHYPMAENRFIFNICVVVTDARQASAHWARVLGVPEAPVETIFPAEAEIIHFTHGQPAAYTDLQVAKYQLEHLNLELMQPGPTPSPWRAFLDRNGPGVFHFCMLVNDRKGFQQTLSEIGVGMPYHVGYFPNGSYSYVNSREQLGLELSVNTLGDTQELFKSLLDGTVAPMDEMIP